MSGLLSVARKSFGQAAVMPQQAPTVRLEDRDLPPGWRMATLPPGQPIRPGQQPWEEGTPREIDYKVSANTTIQPRTNYGLVPFSLLRETYDIISEVKLLIHTLIKEACVLQPQLQNEDGDALPTTDPLYRLIQRPDGVLDWPVWLSRFYRGLLMFDAPSSTRTSTRRRCTSCRATRSSRSSTSTAAARSHPTRPTHRSSWAS